MADILIRGMEMPRRDDYEPLLIRGNGIVEMICGWEDSIHEYDKQAIQLPPHGRLVDADRMRVILCRLKDRLDDGAAIHAIAWAIECLDKLDTIIEADEEVGEDG